MTDETMLVREFEATAVEVEGRTVDVRVVPFGEVAQVADEPGRFYREQWMPGCFDHQLRAANHIHAKYGHSPYVLDVVGHGVTLRQETDGYHLSTKIHGTPQGETALELLRDGALPAVSLEARPVTQHVSPDGIVQRVRADLKAFAFCTRGAFDGAKVLAIREPTVEYRAEELAADMDPDLIRWLRDRGIALPSRYEAHPEDQGTPEDSGTPTESEAPAGPDHTDTED